AAVPCEWRRFAGVRTERGGRFMADVTVSQFAEVLKVPVERLLTQLDEAGIRVSGADDTISDEAKMELLTFLRRAHGRGDDAAPRKITMKRKSQGEIKVASAQGRARTVNVEVRRKKTYLNRSVLEEQARVQQEEADRQRQELEKQKQAQEAKQKEAQEKEPASEQQLEADRKRQEAEALEAERLRREQEEAELQRRAEEEARLLAEENARLLQEARERSEAELREAALAATQAAAAAAAEPARPAERHRERESAPRRKELHVSSDASARFKKRKQSQASRSRRPVQVSVGTQHGFERPAAPVKHEVQIGETITVGELAQKMAVKANEVIKVMMNM